MNQQKEVKVVLLGDSGVGKSSILLRFCSNDFKINQDPTLGAAFMSKVINVQNQAIKYQVLKFLISFLFQKIWDTAGQEKYKSLTPLYYRDAQIALIVYDISNKQSFEVLKSWIKDLKDHGPKKLIQVLVGNKQDLIDQEQVSYDEASTLARNIGATLKLTSCKENKGVQEMFQNIAEMYVLEEQQKVAAQNVKQSMQSDSTVKIKTVQNNKKQSGCC